MTELRTEVELARHVKAYLTGLGFERLYQEIQLPGYGMIADLVAVGRETIIVETKLHLGLDVIAQADQWVGHAHRVFVAVPRPLKPTEYGQSDRMHSPAWKFAEAVLRWRRIGCLVVSPEKAGFAVGVGWEYEYQVSQFVEAPLCSSPTSLGLFDALTPEHETYAEAGNAHGRRLTPFVQTCAALLAAVTEEPGLPVKEYVKRIKHHYPSDRHAEQSLKQWARAGKIRGVKARFDKRRYRLELADRAEDAA